MVHFFTQDTLIIMSNAIGHPIIEQMLVKIYKFKDAPTNDEINLNKD